MPLFSAKSEVREHAGQAGESIEFSTLSESTVRLPPGFPQNHSQITAWLSTPSDAVVETLGIVGVIRRLHSLRLDGLPEDSFPVNECNGDVTSMTDFPIPKSTRNDRSGQFNRPQI